jgi:hypothetical protein
LTDKHYTKPEVVSAIVERLVKYGDVHAGDRVLDPCVGLGAFANAVRALPMATVVRTIDNDPSVEADIHNDFLMVPVRGDLFDLILSNPPFSIGREFVERSIGWCAPTGTVAFLLLLQFLGSNSRADLFAKYPPSTIDIMRPRPSFAEDGSTDMREYALFRWCPQDFGCSGGPRVGWIDWVRTKKIKTAKPLIRAIPEMTPMDLFEVQT